MATTIMDNITDDGHLKRALEYIVNPEKTRGGMYVTGINCPADGDAAYRAFWETKEYFGKDLAPRADGKKNRLAYHYKFSFVPGEVSETVAWEIIKTVAEKLMGNEYEALCSMHVDKAHLHGHLIFNSVSVIDGRKYHYANGDWRRQIQPVVNEICEKHGLSTIDLTSEQKKENLSHAEWEAKKEKQPNISDALKMVIDRCIENSDSYEHFLLSLADAGFEFRDGKHLSIINPSWGMERARRTHKLGEEYTKERIQERIANHRSEDRVERKQQNFTTVNTSRRIFRFRATRITYIRLHQWHRGKHFRLAGYVRRYSRQYWRVLRLWHRLQTETAVPRTSGRSVIIRDFRKLQNRIRILSRYQIDSAIDLDHVLDKLRGRAAVLNAQKKVAKEYGMSDQMESCINELRNIHSDIHLLRRIKKETIESMERQKGLEKSMEYKKCERKRTKTDENEPKRTKMNENEPKRTKTEREKEQKNGI